MNQENKTVTVTQKAKEELIEKLERLLKESKELQAENDEMKRALAEHGIEVDSNIFR